MGTCTRRIDHLDLLARLDRLRVLDPQVLLALLHRHRLWETAGAASSNAAAKSGASQRTGETVKRIIELSIVGGAQASGHRTSVRLAAAPGVPAAPAIRA
jgi:hypothetical protein